MIGNRIKRIREIKCIKQETIAKALGVSQQFYSQIETGQIKLTGEKLDKIAEALDLSVEKIMDFDETKIFENHNFTFDNSSNNIQNNNTNIESLVLELKKAHDAHVADLHKQIMSLERQLEALYKLLDK